jgi:hypothetical protein
MRTTRVPRSARKLCEVANHVHLVVISKLVCHSHPGFAKRALLSREPDDILALLTLGLLNIAYCADFVGDCWAQLLRLKAVSVEMAVFAAMPFEVAGSPNSEAFSALIVATNSARRAKPLLREYRRKWWQAPVEMERLRSRSFPGILTRTVDRCGRRVGLSCAIPAKPLITLSVRVGYCRVILR